MEQETLIYIDDKQKYDASVAANTFTNNSVKNRVYINTLGAELGMKYLYSENIDTSGLKNMHSIKKIIEEFDIADIMLQGIHIDVRVVFDENAIFVPKSHFEYNIIPNIYLVFKFEKEQSRVRFLGFFEPKLINKNNANKDYYFIEKEKLSSPLDLPKYIETHKSGNEPNLSENDIESTESLIIAMADNDISENDKKYLLEQLTKSAELRDKFIEYETFETLSYKAMTDPAVDKHNVAQDITPIDEFDAFDSNQETDEIESVSESLDINEDIINPDDNAETDANIEDFDNITENLEPVADSEQEIFAGEIEDADLLLEDDTESQKAISDDMQNNEINEGLDIDSAVDTLGAFAGTVGAAALAAGAEAGIESIIDNTSASAQELVENASDLAEDLVDLASDDAENIISDTVQEENLNMADDAISIDSVSVENKIEEISENDFEKVDLPEDHEIENNNFDISEIQGNVLEEAVSLKSIIPEDTFMETDKMPEGTISLESIDIPNLPDEDEGFQLDLDDENSYLDNFPEEQPDPNMEGSISLEDIDDSKVGGADNMDAFVSLEDDGVEDLIIDSDESVSEPFGKNLMENLAENEMDGILIDGIDLNAQESGIEQPAADDLLTQIDDVIDTASLSEVPVEPDDTNADVDLDMLDTVSEEDNLTETVIQKSDDADIKAEDVKLDDLLVETPVQADESPVESAENIENLETLDSLEAITSLPQEATSDLVETDDVLQEQPEVSDTILPEEQTEQATDELVKQEPEVDEIENSTTIIPQDYIEDLLDQDGIETESTNSSETEGNDLSVLYTEGETDASETVQPVFDDIDELEEIESDVNTNVPGAAIMNQKKQQNNSSKTLILAAVMVGLIAAATVFYFVKPKDNSSADFEPLPKNSKTALTNNNVKDTDAPANVTKTSTHSRKSKAKAEEENKTTENVLKTNAPEVKKPTAETKKQDVKEIKNTQPQRPIASTAYMSVNKLVWDVPDNLSYSTRMQNYLRTTGKSIKLTLSTDLLLATEYAYADSVKAGITIGKDGSVKSAKILASSGSSQIDNIVLQSVKETLNAIKPPSEDVKGKEFNLNLIIYF